MKFSFLLMIGISIFIVLANARCAHAYIDPNAGSLLLQLILGGIAGIGVFLKIFWKKIKNFFRR